MNDANDVSGDVRPETDADPGDGRNESLNERLDRNWAEILQELRVTQTGTQILTGFLLATAFQSRFADLNDFQHTVYLVLVAVAVFTTAVALAPVHLHRGLFRQRRKLELVRVAHVLVQIALAGVSLVLIGTMLLIFDVVAGRTAGYLAAALTLVVAVGIFALPRVLRRRPGANPTQAEERR
jgi:hypothetical protein